MGPSMTALRTTMATMLAAGATVGIGVGVAHASGPDWLEAPDAGRLPPDAQIPNSFPGSPLFSITGCLGNPLPLEGVGIDFEDMYLICIEDAENFYAFTESPNGFIADFQLWLFAADEFGLLANDDDPGLQPEAFIQSPANDGTGQTIPGPGLYYIAITAKPNQALSASGPIFDFILPTEISGPDGPGGGDQINNWNGGGPFVESPYIIRFNPFTACMPLTCVGDCNMDGTVDVADLLLLLANYGRGAECDIAPEDHPDGVVDIQDLLLLLSNWGPCDPSDG